MVKKWTPLLITQDKAEATLMVKLDWGHVQFPVSFQPLRTGHNPDW